MQNLVYRFPLDAKSLRDASRIDPLINTVTRGYDSNGRLETEGDGTRSISLAYDLAGNVSERTDAFGRTTRSSYDLLGRVLTTTLDDPDGTLTAGLSAPVTSFGYDLLGRLETITAPDPDDGGPLASPVTTYTYDGAGNLASIIDPLSQTTSFAYDALDRSTRVIDADGQTSTTRYDAAGLVLAMIDPKGNTTRYRYEERGRLTTRLAPDTAGDGTLSVSTGYTYDALGRLKTEVDAEGGTTSFGYDAVGNLLTLTDPLGNTTTWTYDDLDRMTTESIDLVSGTGTAATTVTHDRTYEHNALGQLIRTTDRNDRTIGYGYGYEFSYDGGSNYRLTTETWSDTAGTSVHAITWDYHDAGYLSTASDVHSGYLYGYDELGRVTSIDNDATLGTNTLCDVN